MLVTRLQPTRARPLRILVDSDVWRLRTANVGAQEMLGSDVVVHTDTSDIILYISGTEGWMAIQKKPALMKECMRAVVPIGHRVRRVFIRVRNRRWLEATTRYVLIRISTRGHVVGALWDRHRRLIEIFDPLGLRTVAVICLAVLRILLAEVRLMPRFTVVNHKNLQRNDQCCVAWMYRYAMDRIVGSIDRRALVRRYQSMSVDARTRMILDFYDELLRR